MKYGIAIHENDPAVLIKDFIVEANLAKLPLSMLAFESKSYVKVANNLGFEKIGLATMYASSNVEVYENEIFSSVVKTSIDRMYFRMIGDFDGLDPFLHFFTRLINMEKRVGFISPIGEMYKENSLARRILGAGCKGIEYVPIVTPSVKISQELLQSVRNICDKDFTVMLIPLLMNPYDVVEWTNNFLAPNGVSEVIYSSLSCAKPEYYPEEINMATRKRTSTGKSNIRKKKEILLPPPGEPINAKVECLFPLAKRSTPHLNSMIVGSCEVGDQFEIIKVHEITPKLAFAETKFGFYICTKSNDIDYVKFL